MVSNPLPPITTPTPLAWWSAQLYGQLVWPNVNRLPNLISEQILSPFPELLNTPQHGECICQRDKRYANEGIRNKVDGMQGDAMQAGRHQHSQKSELSGEHFSNYDFACSYPAGRPNLSLSLFLPHFNADSDIQSTTTTTIAWWGQAQQAGQH